MTEATLGPDGRPSAKLVQDLSNEMFSLHGMRIQENERMRALVERKYEVFKKPPANYHLIRPGTAGAILHRVASHLVPEVPIVDYAPRAITETAQSDANQIEIFGKSILGGFEKRNNVSPIFDAAKRSLLGMWVLKGPIFDFDAWGDPPARKGKTNTEYKHEMHRYYIRQAENPAFHCESIDPNRVVWDPDSPGNPSWVIHKYWLSVGEIKRRYPHWKNPKNHSQAHNNVLCHEYQSQDWRLVLADGEPVSQYEEEKMLHVGALENVYRFVGYQIGFGAWGFANEKPEDMARSFLYWVEDEIPEQARVASIKSIQMQIYGHTPLLSDDPVRTADELNQGPGAILTVKDPKNKPGPMEMPTPPEWLESYEAQLASSIESRTFSEALMGFRSPGTTSGVFQGLQVGESKQVFAAIVHQLERHVATILNRCGMIHEHLVDEPMTVWAERANGRDMLTIKPDVWHGAYHFNVSLEPVDPARDDRRSMLGLNLFAQGLLDPETVMEDYLKIPDVQQVMRRILKWKILNSPEWIAAVSARAAQQAELPANPTAGAPDVGDFAIEDMAAGGQVPLAPENNEPGALTDFPTRGMTQRPTGPMQTRESQGAY